MRVLFIGGFTEHVGDQSNYWKIADEAAALPGVWVSRKAWDEVASEDLDGVDLVVMYSWGTASFFKVLRSSQRIPVIFILAGVPRGILQCLKVSAQGGWKIPDNVLQATSFNVDSWPVSHPIANPGSGKHNIDLEQIAPGWQHVTIPDCPIVHGTIIGAIKAAI